MVRARVRIRSTSEVSTTIASEAKRLRAIVRSVSVVPPAEARIALGLHQQITTGVERARTILEGVRPDTTR